MANQTWPLRCHRHGEGNKETVEERILSENTSRIPIQHDCERQQLRGHLEGGSVAYASYSLGAEPLGSFRANRNLQASRTHCSS